MNSPQNGFPPTLFCAQRQSRPVRTRSSKEAQKTKYHGRHERDELGGCHRVRSAVLHRGQRCIRRTGSFQARQPCFRLFQQRRVVCIFGEEESEDWHDAVEVFKYRRYPGAAGGVERRHTGEGVALGQRGVTVGCRIFRIRERLWRF